MSVESRVRTVKDIYRNYADMVFGIAFFYVKDPSLAEEMMQDVFVHLIRNINEDKKISGFQRRENQKAWLIITTANQCKEYIQTEWFQENSRSMEYVACIVNGYQSESEEEFFSHLFALPANLAVLLFLYYLQGYSHSELAELLDMKPGMVTIRIKKARRLMKLLRMEVEKMPEWEEFQGKMKRIRCSIDRKEIVWVRLQDEMIKQEANPKLSSFATKKKNPIATYIDKAIIQKKPMYIAAVVILILFLMVAMLPHIVQCTQSVKTRDLVTIHPTGIVKNILND